jgi:hypothetical protein
MKSATYGAIACFLTATVKVGVCGCRVSVCVMGLGDTPQQLPIAADCCCRLPLLLQVMLTALYTPTGTELLWPRVSSVCCPSHPHHHP